MLSRIMNHRRIQMFTLDENLFIMKFPKIIVALLFAALQATSLTAHADSAKLKPFTSGSYRQLLDAYTDKPLVLMIWSVNCTSCRKKMPVMSELRQRMPEVNLIMLATDDASVSEQVDSILTEHKLKQTDNWIFADANPQKLRYEIDPKWYGEVPRTYFIDKNHQRIGISGSIPDEKIEAMIKTILN